jgi:GNAT superfamily N-acetyltransferase
MADIVEAQTAEHLATIRELLREYADSLGVDLCFQDFERELATLPGKYAPPEGRLYLALDDGKVAGCAGLRKISPDAGELKRVYVRPVFRGKGIGRRLVLAVVEAARRNAYRRLCLDTLPSMKRALELYRAMGFKPIEAYNQNPVPGAAFLELTL